MSVPLHWKQCEQKCLLRPMWWLCKHVYWCCEGWQREKRRSFEGLCVWACFIAKLVGLLLPYIKNISAYYICSVYILYLIQKCFTQQQVVISVLRILSLMMFINVIKKRKHIFSCLNVFSYFWLLGLYSGFVWTIFSWDLNWSACCLFSPHLYLMYKWKNETKLKCIRIVLYVVT